MKTMSVEVFQFDELSDRAKERAREWYREGAFDHDWWDAIDEDAKEMFGLIGYRIDKIYFSGFSYQGDGACFEGYWYARDVKPGRMREDAPQDAELHRIAAEVERLAAEFPHAAFQVKHSGNYSHEFCTNFEVEFHDDPIDELQYDTPEWKARSVLLAEAEEGLIEISRDAMRWIYKQLEAQHDYLNEDEQIDEEIRVNDYGFTASGKRCVAVG